MKSFVASKLKCSTAFLWDVLSRSFGLDQANVDQGQDKVAAGQRPTALDGDGGGKSAAAVAAPIITNTYPNNKSTRPPRGSSMGRKSEQKETSQTATSTERPSRSRNACKCRSSSGSRRRTISSKLRNSKRRISRPRKVTRPPTAASARGASRPAKSKSSSDGDRAASLNKRHVTRPRLTKVQFSASSECMLSPGIVRYSFEKPGKKEQRRLRRLAERGRLYMQRHGKELPEEYFERTPTSLVSELNRREKEHRYD